MICPCGKFQRCDNPTPPYLLLSAVSVSSHAPCQGPTVAGCLGHAEGEGMRALSRPRSLHRRGPQSRDGARRDFADQADIACMQGGSRMSSRQGPTAVGYLENGGRRGGGGDC